MLYRPDEALQTGFAIQILAFDSFNFNTVRAAKPNGIERCNDLGEVHSSLAEAAEFPFLFSTLCVFQVDVHNPVCDFADVLGWIDVVVVIENVPRVVVTADVRVRDFFEEFLTSLGVATSLSALGIAKSEIANIASKTAASNSPTGEPRPCSEEDFLSVLQAAY